MARDDQPQAIVILGAAVWPGGQPSPTLRRRIDEAVRQAAAHPAALVICSGGLGRHPPSEAEVMARGLRDSGIPAERILLEDASTSTLENAGLTAAILRERGLTCILVVTSSYHVARARLTFRHFGITARGAPVGRNPATPRWKYL